MRSSMPPWPGNRKPESLRSGGTLEQRLGQVPRLRDQADQRADHQRVPRRQPTSQVPMPAAMVAATRPPARPSIVFDGLM